jgi:hypothetical protein
MTDERQQTIEAELNRMTKTRYERECIDIIANRSGLTGVLYGAVTSPELFVTHGESSKVSNLPQKIFYLPNGQAIRNVCLVLLGIEYDNGLTSEWQTLKA